MILRKSSSRWLTTSSLYRSHQLLKKCYCIHHHGYRELERGLSYSRMAHVRSRSVKIGMGLSLFNLNGIHPRNIIGAGNLLLASCYGNNATNGISEQATTAVPLLRITTFDSNGQHVSKTMRRSELVLQYGIQPRDIRFSVSSSLFTRASSIILKLQHIKAIINSDSVVLLDSDHPAIVEFIPELQEKLRTPSDDSLPFEFRVLEAMLMKILTVLDERLQQLSPALREVLNSLLDPRLFSVDRGELHILLHHSKNLSEFHSIIRDIEATLNEVLDSDEDMTDMYLTHWDSTGEERDVEDIEELCNILEAYSLQVEDMMSEVQKLRELIDQSESVILINLDSQRNVMLRLGLQLEMGMFSAAIGGLIGMAFGMNLDSSLEESPYAFWVVTGIMVSICGLLWRRLLMFLGKLDHSPLKKIARPKTKK